MNYYFWYASEKKRLAVFYTMIEIQEKEKYKKHVESVIIESENYLRIARERGDQEGIDFNISKIERLKEKTSRIESEINELYRKINELYRSIENVSI